MLRKVLQSKIPQEFKQVLDFYWSHDSKFLQSASSYEGEAPSLACLISDVYARRVGKGFVPVQTKNLIESYHSYLGKSLNMDCPTFIMAKDIAVKYGATSALMDLGISDAESHIAADMLMIRRKVFNFPHVKTFDIVSIDKENISKDTLPTTQFIIDRDDYAIAVSMQTFLRSKRNDVKVFNQYLNSGLIPNNSESLSVIEFLVYRDSENDSSQAMYFSTYFADGVTISIPENETEQMIKDALLVADALEIGLLVEQDSVCSRAWVAYKRVVSPSKRKTLAGKLYGERHLVRQYLDFTHSQ